MTDQEIEVLRQAVKESIEVSMTNSEKLDKIVALLEGHGPDMPGLLHRVAMHEEILFGALGRNDGLAQKVVIMYRAHVWVLCTLSAGTGAVALKLIESILTKRP